MLMYSFIFFFNLWTVEDACFRNPVQNSRFKFLDYSYKKNIYNKANLITTLPVLPYV